jgi:hypothetical protein
MQFDADRVTAGLVQLADTPRNGRAPLSHTMAPGGQAVALSLPETVADIAELERLIYELGKIRASMQPAAQMSIMEGNGATPYVDVLTAWPVERGAPAPVEAGALLMGCSSMFGWFALPVSARWCRGLAQWLTDGDHTAKPYTQAMH